MAISWLLHHATGDLSGLAFVIGGLLALVWLILEGSIHARNRGTSPRPRHRSSQDRGSGALILCVTLLGLVVTWTSVGLGWFVLPWWALPLGIAIMSGGIAVRCWALTVLGRFFSPVVRTTSDQVIIRDGPYRWVRHPAYTGILMIALGYPILVLSGVGFVFALVAFGLAIGYRIRVEEAALSARFGEAYNSYRATTTRVIPFII